MTRAMTLIKMYFVGSLRALVADVTKRISEKVRRILLLILTGSNGRCQGVSTTAQTHLLYTRFTTVSSQLAPLLGELERRAAAHPDDLSALLAECHAAYFTARKGLLVPRLMEEIKGLDPARTELVELVSECLVGHRRPLSFRLDSCRVQLFEAVVHRRVRSLPCVL